VSLVDRECVARVKVAVAEVRSAHWKSLLRERLEMKMRSVATLGRQKDPWADGEGVVPRFLPRALAHDHRVLVFDVRALNTGRVRNLARPQRATSPCTNSLAAPAVPFSRRCRRS
jgi:hypothetical protein